MIAGIDDIPDDLKWWSYWRNAPRTGFIEAIEVNMGSREIQDLTLDEQVTYANGFDDGYYRACEDILKWMEGKKNKKS